MTNNFEIIDNILFRKKQIDLYLGDECSPWVINKGVSFHTPLLASMVNMTTNLYHEVLDKQEQIDLLNLMIPKMKYSKSKWIKSVKAKKDANSENMIGLARNLEISISELRDILEVLPEFSDELIIDEPLKTYKAQSK